MNWLSESVSTAITNYHRLGDLTNISFSHFPRLGRPKSSWWKIQHMVKTCSLFHRHPPSVTSHTRGKGANWGIVYQGTHPNHLPESPHFLILSHWGLGSHIWIWEVGGQKHWVHSTDTYEMLGVPEEFSACWQLFHFVILSLCEPGCPDGEINSCPHLFPSCLGWLLPRQRCGLSYMAFLNY